MAVLAAAPQLIERSPDVTQLMAEYLGGIKSHNAHDLLWQVVERPEPAHEQALIALTWIGEAQDLPRLSELLIKPSLFTVLRTAKTGTSAVCLPESLTIRFRH